MPIPGAALVSLLSLEASLGVGLDHGFIRIKFQMETARKHSLRMLVPRWC